MKNIKTIFLFFLFFAPASYALSGVECFDYYKFNTGLDFKDLVTERPSYSAGEEVFALYNLRSMMQAPIVEGKVFVYVFYNDPQTGEELIDEFYVAKGVNMRLNDALEQSFRWTIPKSASPGTYTIKTYFIVGDFFNLDGLSILPYGPPGVPGAQTSFEVKQDGVASRAYFSKKDTSVNGEKWSFGAPSKVFSEGNIRVQTKLVNVGGQKDVEVSLQVYDWADLKGSPMPQYSYTKTVSLAAGGSEPVTYEVRNLPVGAYEFVFSARSVEEKSIMKMRIPVSGERARLIYTGLTDFPLKKGDKTVFFTCFSQSADYSTGFNGTLTVEVFDSKGAKVFSETSDQRYIHPTPPQALATYFTAPENLNYLTVKASLYDAGGKLHDSASLVYDYSKFPEAKTRTSLKLSEATAEAGSSLDYTVSAADEAGFPVVAEVYAYVLDSGGKMVSAFGNKKVDGSLTASFRVPNEPGSYRLVVGETARSNKMEEAFTVTQKSAATTQTATTAPGPAPTTPQQKVWGIDLTTIVIAAAAVLIILFIATRRKKK